MKCSGIRYLWSVYSVPFITQWFLMHPMLFYCVFFLFFRLPTPLFLRFVLIFVCRFISIIVFFIRNLDVGFIFSLSFRSPWLSSSSSFSLSLSDSLSSSVCFSGLFSPWSISFQCFFVFDIFRIADVGFMCTLRSLRSKLICNWISWSFEYNFINSRHFWLSSSRDHFPTNPPLWIRYYEDHGQFFIPVFWNLHASRLKKYTKRFMYVMRSFLENCQCEIIKVFLIVWQRQIFCYWRIIVTAKAQKGVGT